jgi:hypothetical protein
VPSRQLPTVHVELGFGPLEAPLDSGPVRSLMSGHVYITLMRTSSLAQVFPVQVTCITAVTHSFRVHTAVKCKLRMDRYTWKFLLRGRGSNLSSYFGIGFFAKTGLLVDLYQGCAFFRFDPNNKLSLIGRASAFDAPCMYVYPNCSRAFSFDTAVG